MIHLQDHQDSFTYNIAEFFSKVGDVKVYPLKKYLRYEDVKKGDLIILGPGPGKPRDYPKLMAFIKNYRLTEPLLGICLGHQALGLSFGGKLYNSGPKFGVIENLHWRGLKTSQKIVRYHSWSIRFPDSPDLEILSQSKSDQAILAFRHRKLPITGLQFHPESVGSTLKPSWILKILKR